jgi:hypothetical protein
LPAAELRHPAIDGREMELSLNTELNSNPPDARGKALNDLHERIRGLNRKFAASGEVWAMRSDPLKRPPLEFSLKCATFEDRNVRLETAAYLVKAADHNLLESSVADGVATVEVSKASSGDVVFVFLGVAPNDGESLATRPEQVRLVAHP